MTNLRELRRETGWTQAQFAERLGVPLNSFRMWDSELRIVPTAVFRRGTIAVEEHRRQTELLPLATIAAELRIHKSTLEAAIRTGRLTAHYSCRSVFGRPIRRITRADAEYFKQTAYRRPRAPAICSSSLPGVPADFDKQLKYLRNRRCLTQAALAQLIGAAGKAVVYQWESRKRIPSPVFWKRIQQLQLGSRAIRLG